MSNDGLVNVVGRFLFAYLDHRALSDGADHFDYHSILGLEKSKKKNDWSDISIRFKGLCNETRPPERDEAK